MKIFIDLKRDRLGWWRASFEDSPHETYGGFSPRAALRSLFACNPHRFIDESRIIAMDPVSPTHLRFRVKTRVERLALARSR
ncbi:MAG: hypothetical protein IT428_14825 [Planctomycetaceae bacterium]|nr:hypothetical protein [Planctomycetaceae bacterium]